MTSNALTKDQIIDITNHINVYRSKHRANPISHDQTISTFSQSHADKLIATNKFEHSKNRLYGENLAFFGGNKNDRVALIKKAIDNWYAEVKLYDFSNVAFKSGTGHFTQLCWNSSSKFGVGYSYNTSTKTAIISMNFDPAGNVLSKFKDNVFKSN